MNTFNDVLIYTYIKKYIFIFELRNRKKPIETRSKSIRIIKKEEGKEEFKDGFEMVKMKFN